MSDIVILAPGLAPQRRLNLKLPVNLARWVSGQAAFHGEKPTEMVRMLLQQMAAEAPVVPVWADQLPPLVEIPKLTDEVAIAYLQGIHFRTAIDGSSGHMASMSHPRLRGEVAAMVMQAKQAAQRGGLPPEKLAPLARQALMVSRVVETPTTPKVVLEGMRETLLTAARDAFPAPAPTVLTCAACDSRVEVEGADPQTASRRLGWRRGVCATCLGVKLRPTELTCSNFYDCRGPGKEVVMLPESPTSVDYNAAGWASSSVCLACLESM